MTRQMNNQQEVLKNILTHTIFSFVKPSNDEGHGPVRINPRLKFDQIDELEKNTQKNIVLLYMECEYNYSSNMKIFESYMEHRMFENTQSQLDHLRQMKEELEDIMYDPMSDSEDSEGDGDNDSVSLRFG